MAITHGHCFSIVDRYEITETKESAKLIIFKNICSI
jgi:hypothetical protein